MTTPHEPTPRSDDVPSETLQRALSALPAERTPPAEVWAQLQQTITRPAAPVMSRANVTRRLKRVALVGVAAVLAIVVATRFPRTRQGVPADMSAELLPEERRDPRVQAVLDETRHWRVASSDSLRSVRWPREAREAVEASLAATETALASARIVLRQDPGNAAARDAIVELRARQLVMLQRALSLLDDI